MSFVNKEHILYQLRKQLDIDSQPRAIRRAMRIVESAPAENVRPCKKGEWIGFYVDGPGSYAGTCSCCKTTNSTPPMEIANFCPYCGADMRGGA